MFAPIISLTTVIKTTNTNLFYLNISKKVTEKKHNARFVKISIPHSNFKVSKQGSKCQKGPTSAQTVQRNNGSPL